MAKSCEVTELERLVQEMQNSLIQVESVSKKNTEDVAELKKDLTTLF